MEPRHPPGENGQEAHRDARLACDRFEYRERSMDEIDWFTSADPRAMLAVMRGRLSDRKLRLFAVGCCRRIAGLTVGDSDALAVVKRFADGLAGQAELDVIRGL